MQKQINITDKVFPNINSMPKILNHKSAGHRPKNVIWTSTYDSNYISSWIYYISGERIRNFNNNFPIKFEGYELTISLNAKILTIYSIKDWLDMVNNYHYIIDEFGDTPLLYIDWEMLSLNYDAVHMTAKGFMETNNVSNSDYPNYAKQMYDVPSSFSWSMESTCWFRWAFATVEKKDYYTIDYPKLIDYYNGENNTEE
jgi:hypothetical protein